MGSFEHWFSGGFNWTSWVFLILVGIATYFYLKLKRPQRFPPGPPALPLVGSIPFLKHGGDKFYKEFDRLAAKYGDIFSLALGHTWVVVLNDYDVIKEAMVDKSKEFAGRIHDPRTELFGSETFKGIVDGDYSEEWVKQRHNSLVIMRNFGWGKKGIAEKMSEERDNMLEVFRDTEGKPFDPRIVINIGVLNIICSMLFAERFEHDDPKILNLLQHLESMVAAIAKGSEWDNVPILPYFIPGAQEFLNKFVRDVHAVYDFPVEQIAKRRKQDEESPIEEPRDFIEGYLKELKGIPEGKSRINEDWLKDICADLFMAGSETTATTLKWALIYMLHNPEVQRKAQEEMDEVVGKPTGRGMTSLSDRDKLPYTDATIMEIQRMSSIVATALVHKTTADVELKGYKIPKDTQVRYNIHSVLHNPKHWDEPYSFKPERYMSKEGKVVKIEKWIPFGMGRRMCLGEQLARQELFMFFTAIIHSFTVRNPDGASLPSVEPGVAGLILAPPKYEVVFEPRF